MFVPGPSAGRQRCSCEACMSGGICVRFRGWLGGDACCEGACGEGDDRDDRQHADCCADVVGDGVCGEVGGTAGVKVSDELWIEGTALEDVCSAHPGHEDDEPADEPAPRCRGGGCLGVAGAATGEGGDARGTEHGYEQWCEDPLL